MQLDIVSGAGTIGCFVSKTEVRHNENATTLQKDECPRFRAMNTGHLVF